MPNKHNDARRHYIPKMKFKVTNWSSYEAGLRRRGSLTLWVSDEAIAACRAPPRKTPGGQARYSGDSDGNSPDRQIGLPSAAAPD
jgi:hypothetical protein